jgi:cation transport ATPase
MVQTGSVSRRNSMRTLCVDKTGTLTEGRFRLLAMKHDSEACSLERVLHLAASIESLSSHPIAAAFLEFAETLGVKYSPAATFEILEGEGIHGMVDVASVHVGYQSLSLYQLHVLIRFVA